MYALCLMIYEPAPHRIATPVVAAAATDRSDVRCDGMYNYLYPVSIVRNANGYSVYIQVTIYEFASIVHTVSDSDIISATAAGRRQTAVRRLASPRDDQRPDAHFERPSVAAL